MAKRRRSLFVGVGAVALVLVIVLYFEQIRPIDAGPCLGLTESQLVGRLGRPSERWPGSFGLPSVQLLAGHKHIETMAWQRVSGTFFASASDESGARVCFDASWLHRGAVY